jgi:hypothetical protein
MEQPHKPDSVKPARDWSGASPIVGGLMLAFGIMGGIGVAFEAEVAGSIFAAGVVIGGCILIRGK